MVGLMEWDKHFLYVSNNFINEIINSECYGNYYVVHERCGKFIVPNVHISSVHLVNFKHVKLIN